jgi:hypothetical protein
VISRGFCSSAILCSSFWTLGYGVCQEAGPPPSWSPSMTRRSLERELGNSGALKIRTNPARSFSGVRSFSRAFSTLLSQFMLLARAYFG